MKKIDVCPFCGNHTLETRFDHSFVFKHGRREHTVSDLARSVCTTVECLAAFFTPEQLDSNNQRVREYQSNLEDFISPAQVLELREKYDLTQIEASRIFGGGVNSFSRYERGINSPSALSSRTMLRCLRDPAFMEYLRSSPGDSSEHDSELSVRENSFDLHDRIYDHFVLEHKDIDLKFTEKMVHWLVDTTLKVAVMHMPYHSNIHTRSRDQKLESISKADVDIWASLSWESRTPKVIKYIRPIRHVSRNDNVPCFPSRAAATQLKEFAW